MMMRIACALAILAGSAQAQSVKLTAAEIEILLSGNTAVGIWEGAKYRQYFDPDGTTIYAQEDSRSARGKWRVDSDADHFQSIWPSDSEWKGWLIMEYSGQWFWVSKTTPPTPFDVLDGKQLIAN